jgi:CDP-glucose 4,6-dehydratase
MKGHQKSIASARAGNVIGGGDWASTTTTHIIRALAQNDSIQIRILMLFAPWQHVLEPLFGYLLLAMKMHNNPFIMPLLIISALSSGCDKFERND